MQKNIQEKLLKLKEEGRNIKEEISRLKPELQKVVANMNGFGSPFDGRHTPLHFLMAGSLFVQLKSLVAKRTEDSHKLEKRINEIVDRIYKDFSESIGVKNIREYEENQLKAAQEMYERKLSLSNQMSKLKYQYVFNCPCFFEL